MILYYYKIYTFDGTVISSIEEEKKLTILAGQTTAVVAPTNSVKTRFLTSKLDGGFYCINVDDVVHVGGSPCTIIDILKPSHDIPKKCGLFGTFLYGE